MQCCLPPQNFWFAGCLRHKHPTRWKGEKATGILEDLLHRYTNVYALYEPDLDFHIEIFHSKVVGIKEIEGKLV